MDLPFERTLLFAPHPDDESIGTGALLSFVARRGAAIRVVFLTNGDNNPWPQRAYRRRWSITQRDHRAWGRLRRCEARRALATLGVASECATFLGLPDDSLAVMYRRRRDILVEAIAKTICAFRPTLLLIPSIADFHSDHRATYRATLRALFPPEMHKPCLTLSYIVHGTLKSREVRTIPICDADRAHKLAAIECHQTQLLLSRRRFLRYAAREERFGVVTLRTVRDESAVAKWRAKMRHAFSVVR